MYAEFNIQIVKNQSLSQWKFKNLRREFWKMHFLWIFGDIYLPFPLISHKSMKGKSPVFIENIL